MSSSIFFKIIGSKRLKVYFSANFRSHKFALNIFAIIYNACYTNEETLHQCYGTLKKTKQNEMASLEKHNSYIEMNRMKCYKYVYQNLSEEIKTNLFYGRTTLHPLPL